MGGEEVRLKTNCIRTAIGLELYVGEKNCNGLTFTSDGVWRCPGSKATCEPGMFSPGHQGCMFEVYLLQHII